MTRFFRYSIIRFRPYVETGEYANIGIIAFDPIAGEASFELANVRFARIRHFFDARAHEAYSQTIKMLRIELARITDFGFKNLHMDASFVSDHISASRESSIIFSEQRMISSASPIEMVVKGLFDRYVRRDFDKIVDQEAVLTKNIRSAIHKMGFRHFKSLKIEDDIIPITFPLGYEDEEVHAIKTLAFDHKNPLHIVDYGAYWRKRLSYHLDKRNINEHNVLLAISPPELSEDHAFADAFQLALEDLKTLPFELVKVKEDSRRVDPAIMSFVSRYPTRQSKILQ